jgi:hypothetical protein
MPATIEIVPLPDNEPISMEAVMFTHVGCLGELRARRSLTSGQYVLRCKCGLELFLNDESSQQVIKMAVGAEDHQVPQDAITSTSKPITFRIQGQP